MANKIIGITVDIEGKSSGLTKSLQEANSAINKTTSALKDVDKALQLDPTNVELLAQKELLLNKQIEQTNEKLEIMQQVAQDANDALARGDISQEQYASLQAEIAKTSVSLNELEEAADGSADELEETGDEAEESGKSMEAFGEAAKTAGEVAVAAFEATIAAAVAVGAAVAGAMVEAGTALASTTLETSKLADELLTLSSTTGLSTDSLQELNYASELLDVSTDTVTGSMNKLLKTMSSSGGAEKFEELGIAVYDAEGNLRSAEDVFWDTIDVLGTYENESERDIAAMELLGKSARELNPLIEAGSNTFRQLADEAHSVGYVMDSETLDAFGALDDNMQRLTNTTQAVEQSFGQVLLPLMTDASGDLVSLMGDFSGALSEAGGDVDEIGSIIEQFAPRAVALVEEYVPQILTIFESVFNALLPVVASVAPQLISMVSGLLVTVASSISENSEEWITAFGELFQAVVDSAITLLPVLIPLAIQLVQTLVSSLLAPDNLEMVINGAIELIMSLVTTLTDQSNLELILGAATTIILSLLNGLTKALPQLIPAALNAILTIVDTLLSSGCLGQIMQAALTLIVTLASSLIQYLPQLIARLPEIILGIVRFLTGDALPDIIKAGFTLITAIVGNMPEILSAIVQALIALIVGMGEYITGDGAADLLKAFTSAFDGIIEGASTWGTDLIQNFIDGISAMWNSLKDTVSNVAGLISDFLSFSVPDKGPLHEWAFNNPGEDMLELFSQGIDDGMNDLEDTLYNTAATINSDLTGLDMSPDVMVNRTTDFSSFAEAFAGTNGGTWIFPIYLGGDLIDTVVVDALDRYNYQTGGH